MKKVIAIILIGLLVGSMLTGCSKIEYENATLLNGQKQLEKQDVIQQKSDQIEKDQKEKDQKEIDQNEIDQKEIDQKEIDQKEIDQNEIDQKEIDQKEIEQKKIDQKEIDQKEIDQKEIDQKEIDQKEINQKEINQKEIDKKEIEQNKIDQDKKIHIEANQEEVNIDEQDPIYISGQNEFAYNIFSELMGDENVFLSPYSISMALSMLYNGADGSTRQELAKMLGYDQLTGYTKNYSKDANQFMNTNSKLLLDAMQKIDPKVEINIANSIWMSDSFSLKDTVNTAFLEPVRNFYSADVFQTDFTKKQTLDSVNQWVSNNTKGMIDPLLKQFNNAENLKLLLVNAIYFNGKWSYPFSTDKTVNTRFYGTKETQYVQMMNQYDTDYRYYSAKGIRGLELPYGKGSIVMDILIPEDTKNNTISKLYKELSKKEINQFIIDLDQTQVQEVTKLSLPKFEMEYGVISLNEVLKTLGMISAFNCGSADFDLIADDLFVSEVGHKAIIQVEEWGTKAAAVTEIQCEATAIVIDPLQFIVDVPFIFIIRDKTTDSILFMGEMNQPD